MIPLENPMILTRCAYDPQEQPIAGSVCAECGEIIQKNETRFANGDSVCEECLSYYLRDHADQFVGEYIGRHETEYLLDWFWDSLSEIDKCEIDRAVTDFFLSILRIKRKMEKQLNPEAQKLEEKDFCLDSDDFLNFVMKELK